MIISFLELKGFIRRYQSELVYLVVGGFTTLVNLAVYLLTKDLLGLHYIAANIAAWVAAVLFAYITNRRWVFKSKNPKVLYEIGLFVMSRVFSLLCESGLLLVAVEFMHIDSLISKIVIAFVVVAGNYITGKLIVFQQRS